MIDAHLKNRHIIVLYLYCIAEPLHMLGIHMHFRATCLRHHYC